MKLQKSLRLSNGIVVPRGTVLNFSTEGFANYKGSIVSLESLAPLQYIGKVSYEGKLFDVRTMYYNDKNITDINKSGIYSIGYSEVLDAFCILPLKVTSKSYTYKWKSEITGQTFTESINDIKVLYDRDLLAYIKELHHKYPKPTIYYYSNQ